MKGKRLKRPERPRPSVARKIESEAMDKEALQTIFSKGTSNVTSRDAIVMTGKLVDSFYALDIVTLTRRKNEKSFSLTLDTWHERHAHVN